MTWFNFFLFFWSKHDLKLLTDFSVQPVEFEYMNFQNIGSYIRLLVGSGPTIGSKSQMDLVDKV